MCSTGIIEISFWFASQELYRGAPVLEYAARWDPMIEHDFAENSGDRDRHDSKRTRLAEERKSISFTSGELYPLSRWKAMSCQARDTKNYRRSLILCLGKWGRMWARTWIRSSCMGFCSRTDLLRSAIRASVERFELHSHLRWSESNKAPSTTWRKVAERVTNMAVGTKKRD